MNPTAPASLDEVIALCRRLRLRYVREQAPGVLLTAKAQRWDPAERAATRSCSSTRPRPWRSPLAAGSPAEP
jgi:hypothetical protein